MIFSIEFKTLFWHLRILHDALAPCAQCGRVRHNASLSSAPISHGRGRVRGRGRGRRGRTAPDSSGLQPGGSTEHY